MTVSPSAGSDTLLLDEETALVTWLEQTATDWR